MGITKTNPYATNIAVEFEGNIAYLTATVKVNDTQLYMVTTEDGEELGEWAIESAEFALEEWVIEHTDEPGFIDHTDRFDNDF